MHGGRLITTSNSISNGKRFETNPQPRKPPKKKTILSFPFPSSLPFPETLLNVKRTPVSFWCPFARPSFSLLSQRECWCVQRAVYALRKVVKYFFYFGCEGTSCSGLRACVTVSIKTNPFLSNWVGFCSLKKLKKHLKKI